MGESAQLQLSNQIPLNDYSDLKTHLNVPVTHYKNACVVTVSMSGEASGGDAVFDGSQ